MSISQSQLSHHAHPWLRQFLWLQSIHIILTPELLLDIIYLIFTINLSMYNKKQQTSYLLPVMVAHQYQGRVLTSRVSW